MTLVRERYEAQKAIWPKAGRHILAQFDSETVVVYQAYSTSIGQYAAKHGRLGGEGFSWSRMSWIKPNFLWMMYRSGWGTKPEQEVTLALRVRRPFFDSLLMAAIPSSWDSENGDTVEEWRQSVSRSQVRLQWDPDHAPNGGPVNRRALQLGLRGPMLAQFGKQELVDVVDLSEFVSEQRERLAVNRTAELETPRERLYVPTNDAIRQVLRLSEPE